MMWHHGAGWHWLGSLAVILFWALIIVLALAPIKYLRAQLQSPELGEASDKEEQHEDASGEPRR
ncbi:MAG TPA: hypothetical protein VJ698_19825 [Noviherbaspirillum sp.]|uniref:hypothetical protein n=1 Tax=Noviherbaspirillum sp. TaxID=1926288 RepID=UPI002B45EB76|nr:hypothetical protein [Noviherbaspirillum sp.]HJV87729.1 hypothetical protein [Noviherbaspirillum sp.]